MGKLPQRNSRRSRPAADIRASFRKPCSMWPGYEPVRGSVARVRGKPDSLDECNHDDKKDY